VPPPFAGALGGRPSWLNRSGRGTIGLPGGSPRGERTLLSSWGSFETEIREPPPPVHAPGGARRGRGREGAPDPGHALPHLGQALPHSGQRLPELGQAFPHLGQPLPQMGQPLPQMGQHLPQMGQTLPPSGQPPFRPAKHFVAAKFRPQSYRPPRKPKDRREIVVGRRNPLRRSRKDKDRPPGVTDRP
jgi:hypothetical protein